RQANYPYFLDLRGGGMAADSFITNGLGQLTVTWASPITMDDKLPGNLQVQTLLRSSDRSWLGAGENIKPVPANGAANRQPPHGDRASHSVGIVVSGRFQSWFND